jgi:hypothetical protein
LSIPISTEALFSQLRGAQITLQQLQKEAAANGANLLSASTQEPLKEISYADDDSDDEEQSDTKKWDDADIHKVLTINKYLVKETGGAKDSDERKPPLYIRIQNGVKVSNLISVSCSSPACKLDYLE